mmetsp:Transcript_3981/g.6788  ORF Transcript_3981/g.6788 Transcript_3981/m.6788 type:complete len:85 (+) Transcript_3981:187-441(+)
MSEGGKVSKNPKRPLQPWRCIDSATQEKSDPKSSVAAGTLMIFNERGMENSILYNNLFTIRFTSLHLMPAILTTQERSAQSSLV